MRTQIIHAAARPPEFISDHLLKVTFELCGHARAVTFVVAYAPTETQDSEKEHTFWTALDKPLWRFPRMNSCLCSWTPMYAREGKGGRVME